MTPTPIREDEMVADAEWLLNLATYYSPGHSARKRLERIATALSSERDLLMERVEQIISAWAFAHNIDGASRNDLFERIRADTGVTGG